MAFPTEVQMTIGLPCPGGQGGSWYSMVDFAIAGFGGRVVTIEEPVYERAGI